MIAEAQALNQTKMDNNFLKVKNYLIDLGFEISFESSEEGVLIIQNQEEAISNLVIGVAAPLVIIEQYLFTKKNGSVDLYKNLLMKNQFQTNHKIQILLH